MTDEQVKKFHSPEYHLLKAQELLDAVDTFSILGVNTSMDLVLQIGVAADLAAAHAAVAAGKMTFREGQKVKTFPRGVLGGGS